VRPSNRSSRSGWRSRRCGRVRSSASTCPVRAASSLGRFGLDATVPPDRLCTGRGVPKGSREIPPRQVRRSRWRLARKRGSTYPVRPQVWPRISGTGRECANPPTGTWFPSE
jgi:hypothetical protein